jgi:membrane-associated phospholipid phosphatase
MLTKKISIIFLIVILCCSSFLKAERQDTSVVVKVLKHGLNDTKNWAISPVKWDSKDWIIFGGVTAATGALIAWGDQPVYNFANTTHTSNRDLFFKYIEPLGNNYLFVAMPAIFLTGLITKNNYTTETSLIAFESFALTGLACQILKMTAGRVRPNNDGTTNPHQWDGPINNGHSFFSGHTSSVFSVASVIAYRYRDTKWVPVLSYSLATLAGFQRIYNNRHWASDVFFGAAVGTATGIFLCKSWEKSTIRFYPSFSPEYSQLTLVIPLSK